MKGRGGGGSFVSTYKRDGRDGMTTHELSNSYYIKKGLLLTVIRIRGIVETRRCGAVAVWSQVITWSSALTLYALYLSRPLPPFPWYQSRPFFLRLGRLSPPLFTLTRGIQGCPKTTSFDKSTWHPIFEKSLQSSFSLPLGTRAFSQHPLPKNALPPSSVINPRILFPFFLSLQFFHPSLINANYLCRRTFWNLPVNPAWRVPGFMEGGEGKQITSIVTQFYCPLSPNSQTSEFLIYSFCTFKNFC